MGLVGPNVRRSAYDAYAVLQESSGANKVQHLRYGSYLRRMV